MKKVKYGFGKNLSISYDEALQKVPAALKEQGFGVLTEIDVKATLKKKIDVDFRKYKILGVCNPPFAYKALSAELEIGLLLPCNVVVYEDSSGKATVMVMDPVAIMTMVENPDIQEVAGEVKARLEKAINSIDGHNDF